MNLSPLFYWWTGSNLQVSIVLFLVLCAVGTLVSLALVRINRPSEAEQAADDAQQVLELRRVSSANYWREQA